MIKLCIDCGAGKVTFEHESPSLEDILRDMEGILNILGLSKKGSNLFLGKEERWIVKQEATYMPTKLEKNMILPTTVTVSCFDTPIKNMKWKSISQLTNEHRDGRWLLFIDKNNFYSRILQYQKPNERWIFADSIEGDFEEAEVDEDDYFLELPPLPEKE